MSGELAKGFLDDIVANIDDDTPRLIYADWLMENGQDDRAEFIRVQIERARRPAWDAAQLRLRLREDELIARHGEAWLAEVPAVEGATWAGFRRGIVAEVTFASYEAMRANVQACRAVAPVEAVKVRWPRVPESAAGPPVAELRELSLTGWPDMEDAVQWLAASPQLATLHKLTARGLWVEALEDLAASPHLGRLRVLRLPANNMGNAGVRALTEAATLTGLEELDLSGPGQYERYRVDPATHADGLEAFAAWPGLAGMRSLTLSDTDVRRSGIRALLRSPLAASLKRLALRNARLEGPAVGEFAEAVAGLSLDELDLGANVIKQLGADYLAAARCLREVKALRIDRCEIPLGGAKALAKAAFLATVRRLDLGFNPIGPVGLRALLEAAPPHLHAVGLRDTDLFDKGAELLASSPAVSAWQELDLSQNSLGPTAAASLGASPNLGQLLVLRMAGNAIGTAMAEHLGASPVGSRLASLTWYDAPVVDEDGPIDDEVDPPQGPPSGVPF